MRKIEVTKEIYKAYDGIEFSSKEECKRYEEQLNYEKLRTKAVNRCKLNIKMNNADLYLITNIEDYKYIISYLRYLNFNADGCYILGNHDGWGEYNPDETIYWFERHNSSYIQHEGNYWLDKHTDLINLLISSANNEIYYKIGKTDKDGKTNYLSKDKSWLGSTTPSDRLYLCKKAEADKLIKDFRSESTEAYYYTEVDIESLNNIANKD